MEELQALQFAGPAHLSKIVVDDILLIVVRRKLTRRSASIRWIGSPPAGVTGGLVSAEK